MGLLTKIRYKLSEVLSFDNKTGTNDIEVTSGQSIETEGGAGPNIIFSGDNLEIYTDGITGSKGYFYLGDAYCELSSLNGDIYSYADRDYYMQSSQGGIYFDNAGIGAIPLASGLYVANSAFTTSKTTANTVANPFILNSRNSSIAFAVGLPITNSGIIGGNGHTLNSNIDSSLILGGTSLTADKDDYVFVPNIEIQGGIGIYTVDPTTNGSWGDRAIPDKAYVDSIADPSATATLVASDTIQSLAIAIGTTVGFEATVVGHTPFTGDKVYYSVKGLIENDGGTTALVDTVTIEKISEGGALDALTVSASANNGTNSLDITVTQGANSTNWSSKITTTVL